MHWRKMKIHLKHWANSLEEEGYHADAKYIREELMSKIDNDLPIYNERGKQKILELIERDSIDVNIDTIGSSGVMGRYGKGILRFCHLSLAPLSLSD